FLHDLAAGGLHRVEREAELVTAHLEEHGAFAARGDRSHPAVLAAVELFDADHLGAEVTQHGAAEGAGDVAAENENAYSVQNARHQSLACRWGQSKKVFGFRKTARTRQPSSVQASWRLPALRQTY